MAVTREVLEARKPKDESIVMPPNQIYGRRIVLNPLLKNGQFLLTDNQEIVLGPETLAELKKAFDKGVSPPVARDIENEIHWLKNNLNIDGWEAEAIGRFSGRSSSAIVPKSNEEALACASKGLTFNPFDDTTDGSVLKPEATPSSFAELRQRMAELESVRDAAIRDAATGKQRWSRKPENRVTAIMVVRDEEWCVSYTFPHVLRWADNVIVMLHCCTDKTKKIMWEITKAMGKRGNAKACVYGEYPKVRFMEENNPTFRHRQMLQRLLVEARRPEYKTAMILQIDADEVLSFSGRGDLQIDEYGNPSCVAWVREGGNPEIQCSYNMRWWQMHTFDSIVIPKSDEPNMDAAFNYPNEHSLQCIFPLRNGTRYKLEADGYDMHGRVPAGIGDRFVNVPAYAGLVPAYAGLVHLARLNQSRMLERAAWYKMVETVRFAYRYGERSAEMIDRYYDKPFSLRPYERIVAINADEFYPTMQGPSFAYGDVAHLDCNPKNPSWFAVECRLMMKQYGRAMFDGLDLYDVV